MLMGKGELYQHSSVWFDRQVGIAEMPWGIPPGSELLVQKGTHLFSILCHQDELETEGQSKWQ